MKDIKIITLFKTDGVIYEDFIEAKNASQSQTLELVYCLYSNGMYYELNPMKDIIHSKKIIKKEKIKRWQNKI
jgi:hypothetical protein